MKKLEDMSEEEFEKAIDEILNSPSGEVCKICGTVRLNKDSINFDESIECCEKHSFVVLCPKHWRWYWMHEKMIGKSCILLFHQLQEHGYTLYKVRHFKKHDRIHFGNQKLKIALNLKGKLSEIALDAVVEACIR